MNPPYAVAGKDIEVGMTVALSPGADHFTVHAILPAKSTPLLQVLVDLQGERHVVEKAAWYAEVEL